MSDVDQQKSDDEIDSLLDALEEISTTDDLDNLASGETPAKPNTVMVLDQDSINETAAVLSGLFFETFDLLTPNWEVTEKQCEKLGKSYAVVIEKYFPGGLKNFGPEFMALMVTVIIFKPKMKIPLKKPKNVTDKSEVEK